MYYDFFDGITISIYYNYSKNFKCKAILNNLSQISNQIQNKTISNSLKLEQIC